MKTKTSTKYLVFCLDTQTNTDPRFQTTRQV